MKTIEIKLYKFSELSNEAKEKALEKLWDINVGHEWWDSVYMDAENIGLKITGFDIDRASYCKGDFLLSANEVAQNILNEHGETCDTYQTAKDFLDEWNPVFAEYMDETSEKYESYDSEQELLEMEDEFLKSLCEDYLSILRNEAEYLTTEQAIIDTIEANEYDFTEDGKMY